MLFCSQQLYLSINGIKWDRLLWETEAGFHLLKSLNKGSIYQMFRSRRYCLSNVIALHETHFILDSILTITLIISRTVGTVVYTCITRSKFKVTQHLGWVILNILYSLPLSHAPSHSTSLPWKHLCPHYTAFIPSPDHKWDRCKSVVIVPVLKVVFSLSFWHHPREIARYVKFVSMSHPLPWKEIW